MNEWTDAKLVREVICTNFFLTVTALTCVQVFLLTAHNRHIEQPPFKPNDFSSLTRFTRFIKSADLSEFLSLGY